MKTIQWLLNNSSLKPVIRLENYELEKVLIDTGADTPVWCSDEETLMVLFPDAYDSKKKFILSGFGKNATVANVYVLPRFYLKSGSIEVLYENLLVAISNRPEMGFDMVLPGTMFLSSELIIKPISTGDRVLGLHLSKMSYKVDYFHKKLLKGEIEELIRKEIISKPDKDILLEHEIVADVVAAQSSPLFTDKQISASHNTDQMNAFQPENQPEGEL